MWTDWFLAPPPSLLWVLLGTAGMYATALLLARWAGVRSFAQMSAFDVAVTIAIGSVMATTIAAPSPSLMQGVVALFGLYALQLLVSRLRARWNGVEASVDNAPILLMGEGGTMLPENMTVARVTEDDLRRILRKANVIDPARIQAVVMEGTGNVNVLHDHDRAPGADAWILQNVRDYSGTLRPR